MGRVTPVFRISLGLAVMTCAIVVLADLLGMLPEAPDEQLESRIKIVETLSVQTTPLIADEDFASIRQTLIVAVRRNDSLLSAGMRATGGHLMISAGDHRQLWKPETEDRSSATHVRIPMFRDGAPWATLEVRFSGTADQGPSGLLASVWEKPLFRLLLFIGGMGFVSYWIFMRRTLRHLDPSAVIPTRVQAALDVMSEGVLLLDPNGCIVLANKAFAVRLGRTVESLLGVQASSLGWRSRASAEDEPEYPWWQAIREGRTSTGTSLCLETESGEVRVYLLNVSPILDGWNKPKGAIATFDDVTELEHKKEALESAMAELEKSQYEIRLQNAELETLAKKDPLTGLSNRRAFLEWFEVEFTRAQNEGLDLRCIMLDIDHFKQVNDTHGHTVGDGVICSLAELISGAVRDTDAVCRYGGEEFCIVVPQASKEAAGTIADRMCRKARSPGFARVPMTVSFGVASIQSGAASVGELIDLADQALYASKESGRDRVTHFEDILS